MALLVACLLLKNFQVVARVTHVWFFSLFSVRDDGYFLPSLSHSLLPSSSFMRHHIFHFRVLCTTLEPLAFSHVTWRTCRRCLCSFHTIANTQPSVPACPCLFPSSMSHLEPTFVYYVSQLHMALHACFFFCLLCPSLGFIFALWFLCCYFQHVILRSSTNTDSLSLPLSCVFLQLLFIIAWVAFSCLLPLRPQDHFPSALILLQSLALHHCSQKKKETNFCISTCTRWQH